MSGQFNSLPNGAQILDDSSPKSTFFLSDLGLNLSISNTTAAAKILLARGTNQYLLDLSGQSLLVDTNKYAKYLTTNFLINFETLSQTFASNGYLLKKDNAEFKLDSDIIQLKRLTSDITLQSSLITIESGNSKVYVGDDQLNLIRGNQIIAFQPETLLFQITPNTNLLAINSIGLNYRKDAGFFKVTEEELSFDINTTLFKITDGSAPSFFRPTNTYGYYFDSTQASFYFDRFSNKGLFLSPTSTLIGFNAQSYLNLTANRVSLALQNAGAFLDFNAELGSVVLSRTQGEQELILSEINTILKNSDTHYFTQDADNNTQIVTPGKLSLNANYITLNPARPYLEGLNLKQVGFRVATVTPNVFINVPFPKVIDENGVPTGALPQITIAPTETILVDVINDPVSPKIQFSLSPETQAGLQGSTGLRGPQGTLGATGLASGPQGITGLRGLVGNTGIKGNLGNTGILGLQGVTGLQGLPTAGYFQGTSIRLPFGGNNTIEEAVLNDYRVITLTNGINEIGALSNLSTPLKIVGQSNQDTILIASAGLTTLLVSGMVSFENLKLVTDVPIDLTGNYISFKDVDITSTSSTYILKFAPGITNANFENVKITIQNVLSAAYPIDIDGIDHNFTNFTIDGSLSGNTPLSLMRVQGTRPQFNKLTVTPGTNQHAIYVINVANPVFSTVFCNDLTAPSGQTRGILTIGENTQGIVFEDVLLNLINNSSGFKAGVVINRSVNGLRIQNLTMTPAGPFYADYGIKINTVLTADPELRNISLKGYIGEIKRELFSYDTTGISSQVIKGLLIRDVEVKIQQNRPFALFVCGYAAKQMEDLVFENCHVTFTSTTHPTFDFRQSVAGVAYKKLTINDIKVDNGAKFINFIGQGSNISITDITFTGNSSSGDYLANFKADDGNLQYLSIVNFKASTSQQFLVLRSNNGSIKDVVLTGLVYTSTFSGTLPTLGVVGLETILGSSVISRILITNGNITTNATSGYIFGYSGVGSMSGRFEAIQANTGGALTYFQGGAWITLTSIIGIQGVTGIQGLTGPSSQGVTGIKGLNGAQGVTGLPGNFTVNPGFFQNSAIELPFNNIVTLEEALASGFRVITLSEGDNYLGCCSGAFVCSGVSSGTFVLSNPVRIIGKCCESSSLIISGCWTNLLISGAVCFENLKIITDIPIDITGDCVKFKCVKIVSRSTSYLLKTTSTADHVTFSNVAICATNPTTSLYPIDIDSNNTIFEHVTISGGNTGSTSLALMRIQGIDNIFRDLTITPGLEQHGIHLTNTLRNIFININCTDLTAPAGQTRAIFNIDENNERLKILGCDLRLLNNSLGAKAGILINRTILGLLIENLTITYSGLIFADYAIKFETIPTTDAIIQDIYLKGFKGKIRQELVYYNTITVASQVIRGFTIRDVEVEILLNRSFIIFICGNVINSMEDITIENCRVTFTTTTLPAFDFRQAIAGVVFKKFIITKITITNGERLINFEGQGTEITISSIIFEGNASSGNYIIIFKATDGDFTYITLINIKVTSSHYFLKLISDGGTVEDVVLNGFVCGTGFAGPLPSTGVIGLETILLTSIVRKVIVTSGIITSDSTTGYIFGFTGPGSMAGKFGGTRITCAGSNTYLGGGAWGALGVDHVIHIPDNDFEITTLNQAIACGYQLVYLGSYTSTHTSALIIPDGFRVIGRGATSILEFIGVTLTITNYCVFENLKLLTDSLIEITGIENKLSGLIIDSTTTGTNSVRFDLGCQKTLLHGSTLTANKPVIFDGSYHNVHGLTATITTSSSSAITFNPTLIDSIFNKCKFTTNSKISVEGTRIHLNNHDYAITTPLSDDTFVTTPSSSKILACGFKLNTNNPTKIEGTNHKFENFEITSTSTSSTAVNFPTGCIGTFLHNGSINTTGTIALNGSNIEFRRVDMESITSALNSILFDALSDQIIIDLATLTTNKPISILGKRNKIKCVLILSSDDAGPAVDFDAGSEDNTGDTVKTEIGNPGASGEDHINLNGTRNKWIGGWICGTGGTAAPGKPIKVSGNDNTVENTLVQPGSGKPGIELTENGAVITKVTIKDPTNAQGINVIAATGAIITKVTIKNPVNSKGIKVIASTGAIITEVTIKTPVNSDGFEIIGSTGAIITKVTIKDNSSTVGNDTAIFRLGDDWNQIYTNNIIYNSDIASTGENYGILFTGGGSGLTLNGWNLGEGGAEPLTHGLKADASLADEVSLIDINAMGAQLEKEFWKHQSSNTGAVITKVTISNVKSTSSGDYPAIYLDSGSALVPHTDITFNGCIFTAPITSTQSALIYSDSSVPGTTFNNLIVNGATLTNYGQLMTLSGGGNNITLGNINYEGSNSVSAKYPIEVTAKTDISNISINQINMDVKDNYFSSFYAQSGNITQGVYSNFNLKSDWSSSLPLGGTIRLKADATFKTSGIVFSTGSIDISGATIGTSYVFGENGAGTTKGLIESLLYSIGAGSLNSGGYTLGATATMP